MNRTFVRATTAAAAVSAAALFFPAVATGAPVDATNCATVSTGTDANGWGNPFPEEAGATYSDTTAIDADGSLVLATEASSARKAWYHPAGGLKATDIEGPLKFKQTEGNANWQIRVTGAATQGAPASENGFATFAWASPGTTGDQNATDATNWWSTRNLPGIPKGTPSTLDALIEAAGAGTVVTNYGVSAQPATPGETVYVDSVSFNGCTTNFKATGSAGGDSSGSLGGLGLGNLIPGLFP
jgi:hypothetical protein